MVPLLKLSFIANGNNPTSIGLALGSTIHFNSLEFTADRLGCLCLSPQEGASGSIFVGMVHIGSPSLRTTLEESDEDATASSAWGALDPPTPDVATW
jgi:hypothetical protein